MRWILLLLLAGTGAPVLAQHGSHGDMGPPATGASCTPEHAAMGHCELPAQDEGQAGSHAGHEMPAATQPQATDPHAGHQMPVEPRPQAQPGSHAGHQMPAQQADLHAGHVMAPAAGPETPIGPPPPAALSGPRHAADIVHGAAMERARAVLREEHGGLPSHKLLVDRAETRVRDGRDGYLLDAQGWYGGDIDKLWLKTEIEGEWGGRIEHGELQALWSRAIGPWFDLQAGGRFDAQPGPNRTHLVLGLQGLAPYWWEVEGAVFLSDKGELTARAEAEYDLRITQDLILQPRAEAELSAQDIDEVGIGAGLSEVSLGARLRYQISPLVAPYVGLEYERAFGDTADLRRAEGDEAGSFNVLAGIRFWF